MDFLLISGI